MVWVGPRAFAHRAPEEQGLTPEGATRDTPEAVCPTCGGAVTVTEPYRTDMPGVLDSRNVRRYAAIPGWTLVPSVGVTVVATDLWKSTVEMAAELPERMEAEAEIARLRAALDAIIHELGVPGEGYPTPVANAYDIARAALAPQEASDGDH